MCNLTKKTRKKTVTVYKAVLKIGKNYYSCFAGTKIQLGQIKPQTEKDYYRIRSRSESANFFEHYNDNYNENMRGKISGFAKKKNAQLLCGWSDRVMLKIILGGEIWTGTARRVSSLIPYDEIIFAGTEVISFKEIKFVQKLII
jgi:hypothetical protein